MACTLALPWECPNLDRVYMFSWCMWPPSNPFSWVYWWLKLFFRAKCEHEWFCVSVWTNEVVNCPASTLHQINLKLNVKHWLSFTSKILCMCVKVGVSTAVVHDDSNGPNENVTVLLYSPLAFLSVLNNWTTNWICRSCHWLFGNMNLFVMI